MAQTRVSTRGVVDDVVPGLGVGDQGVAGVGFVVVVVVGNVAVGRMVVGEMAVVVVVGSLRGRVCGLVRGEVGASP